MVKNEKQLLKFKMQINIFVSKKNNKIMAYKNAKNKHSESYRQNRLQHSRDVEALQYNVRAVA